MNRVQRLNTTICDRQVVAMRYRISSLRWCPWLVAIGGDILPENPYARGKLLSTLYRATTR